MSSSIFSYDKSVRFISFELTIFPPHTLLNFLIIRRDRNQLRSYSVFFHTDSFQIFFNQLVCFVEINRYGSFHITHYTSDVLGMRMYRMIHVSKYVE